MFRLIKQACNFQEKHFHPFFFRNNWIFGQFCWFQMPITILFQHFVFNTNPCCKLFLRFVATLDDLRYGHSSVEWAEIWCPIEKKETLYLTECECKREIAKLKRHKWQQQHKSRKKYDQKSVSVLCISLFHIINSVTGINV